MQKKQLDRRRKVVFVCVSISLIIMIGLHFQKNVNSVILSVSGASVKAIAAVAVNEAIYLTLNEEIRYSDLITIEKDNNGKIASITTNSLKVNEIARDTAYVAQQNLKRLGGEGIYIPIGALTGAKALAGFGPKINIKIIPIGNVASNFVSEFKSAGINQTNHRIILEVLADISIITPTATTNVLSKTEVLICESLIVGDVPKALLTSDIFSSKYSLAA